MFQSVLWCTRFAEQEVPRGCYRHVYSIKLYCQNSSDIWPAYSDFVMSAECCSGSVEGLFVTPASRMTNCLSDFSVEFSTVRSVVMMIVPGNFLSSLRLISFDE